MSHMFVHASAIHSVGTQVGTGKAPLLAQLGQILFPSRPADLEVSSPQDVDQAPAGL